jgi:hypothetical protein
MKSLFVDLRRQAFDHLRYLATPMMHVLLLIIVRAYSTPVTLPVASEGRQSTVTSPLVQAGR